MKTAIITGASSEIGIEICNSLGQDGYKVICQYTSKEEGLLLQS